MTTRLPTRRIFFWPLTFAVLSLAGLVLGLTGDGWRDAASWLFLGTVPMAVAISWLCRNLKSNL